MSEEIADDIDVPYTSMSSKDLHALKGLFQQSMDHYQKILLDVTALKEGDIRAIHLCMNEVKKDIAEIEQALSQKLIKDGTAT
jgi:hypothetical protein